MRVRVSIESAARTPEAAYALRHLLGGRGVDLHFGPAPHAVLLHYGAGKPQGEPALWIRPSPWFAGEDGPALGPADPAPVALEGMPVLFAGPEPRRIRRRPGRIEVSADLLASAFFLLSGFEERADPRRDEHGRFRADFSRLASLGLLEVPLVDLHGEWIAARLAELAGLPPEAGPEEGFAIVLSHDVDGLSRPKRPSGEGTFRKAGSVLAPILEMEERFGVRSTFLFLASPQDPVKPRYALAEDRAREALAAAAAAGAEVGLHGSYACPDRPGGFREERRALAAAGAQPVGFRQHYLRISAASLGRLEEAGFLYDSSLGWPDAPGFRNGTARPFRPFDFRRRRARDLLEIPLVAMDRTLEKYLGLTAEQAWAPLERILEAVRARRGCASLLWHPEFFDAERHPGYDRLYERTLRWLAANGAQTPRGSEAARRWAGILDRAAAAP